MQDGNVSESLLCSSHGSWEIIFPSMLKELVHEITGLLHGFFNKSIQSLGGFFFLDNSKCRIHI